MFAPSYILIAFNSKKIEITVNTKEIFWRSIYFEVNEKYNIWISSFGSSKITKRSKIKNIKAFLLADKFFLSSTKPIKKKKNDVIKKTKIWVLKLNKLSTLPISKTTRDNK